MPRLRTIHRTERALKDISSNCLGLIMWKASKQDTVTTSTTEAELLALSQVAKEALFTSRLLNELQVKLADQTITIKCDNRQTIQLVTTETAQLNTKLRHVDIHNHWLRREVAQGRIRVTYTQSSEMIADGLTKALPGNKWSKFLDQLGLVNVAEDLNRKEVQIDELEDGYNGSSLRISLS